MTATLLSETDFTVEARAARLLEEHRQLLNHQTDTLFTLILAIQWVAGIVLAFLVSPRAWSGGQSTIHAHVWLAVFVGGLLTVPPIVLVRLEPNGSLNRYVIAVAQMLWSSLLIHVTGGRIESHFHLFGSLAFLAFYRDWRVLVCASLVTTVDHFVRGIYWPLSIYGTVWSSPWRWVEHTGWVIFSDIFLIRSCFLSQREMRHIADRAAIQSDLLYHAQHDVLTGLPNRLYFRSRLEELLQKADEQKSKLALLFVDLDGFKQINDRLGHLAGDELLKLVGGRLRASIRPSDQVVRLSGDEFAVILTNVIQENSIHPVANRLLESMETPFRLSGQDVAVGASIGICIYPTDAGNALDLQKNADMAMYQVKHSGKHGLHYFNPDLAAGAMEARILQAS